MDTLQAGQMVDKINKDEVKGTFALISAALKIASAQLTLQKVPTLTGFIADSDKTKGSTLPDGKT